MAGAKVFNFKQFAIRQDGCAMKVGTDGVLLGAWCRIQERGVKALLDIGAGSGLISMQLAQRTDFAKIDAVEIDPAACKAAMRNFNACEWSDRLTLHCAAIQDFTTATHYDHIVSNPPWFVDSLVSQDSKQNLARHTESLSYDDLMKCCFKLLSPQGRVSLVVPAGAETDRMIAAAETNGFVATRKTDVYSTLKSAEKSAPKRTLMEFSRKTECAGEEFEHSSLVIEDGGPGTFSDEYRALTRDFYLKF